MGGRVCRQFVCTAVEEVNPEREAEVVRDDVSNEKQRSILRNSSFSESRRTVTLQPTVFSHLVKCAVTLVLRA